MAHDGQILNQGQPTRWEGQQEIDWMASNCLHDIAVAPHLLPLHISDHIPIRVELTSNKVLAPSGFSSMEQIGVNRCRQVVTDGLNCWNIVGLKIR